MNIEDVKKVMSRICPEMLTNDNFMNNTVKKYCNGEFCNIKALSNGEFEVWRKLSDVIRTATVGQVINYLKENFNPEDKLCYMDCVEGYKNDCTYVTKDQLGTRFFYYVKVLKDRNMKRCNSTKEQEDDLFPYVNDNDVVIT